MGVPFLAGIQVFRRGGSIWHPQPENLEISSLRKRYFRLSEAKSACIKTWLFMSF